MQENNPKLEQFSDREILEIILSNQVNLGQRILKIDTFLSQNNDDYNNIRDYNHKADVFNKLLKENISLLQQIRSDQKE